MKKNGFTLIELLAVIVILAIIALIATPIILGIINDARKESQERSAELYLNAVELAIARRNLTEEFNPTECTIQSDGNLSCKDYEDNPLIVEVDGEVPTSGTIVFTNNKATSGALEFGESFTATISDGKINIDSASGGGTNEPKEVLVNFSDICTPVTELTKTTGKVPTGNYNYGDEYLCKVDPNKPEYRFFVLSKEDNKVNLILESNIRTGGELVKEANPTDNQKGLIAWLSTEDYSAIVGEIPDEILNDVYCEYDGSCVDPSYGPITAMNYLKEATSTWKTGTLITKTVEIAYTETSFEIPSIITAPVRLPKLNELDATGCTYVYDDNADGNCTWLLNYLKSSYIENVTNVAGIDGYWTLSTDNGTDPFKTVYFQGYDSATHPDSAGFTTYYGVRPVITLSI